MNSNSSISPHTIAPDQNTFRNQAYHRHMRRVGKTRKEKQHRRNNWFSFLRVIGAVGVVSLVMSFFMFT